MYSSRSVDSRSIFRFLIILDTPNHPDSENFQNEIFKNNQYFDEILTIYSNVKNYLENKENSMAYDTLIMLRDVFQVH